jgi:hypothetical protein
MNERLTPLAAAIGALAAFACCVPIGLVSAFGILTVSSLFAPMQRWFLPAATVLLAIAALQLWRGQRTCRTRGRRFSLVVFSLSATVVLAVLLFPQVVAGLFADYLL